MREIELAELHSYHACLSTAFGIQDPLRSSREL
jgi:hypothetical protein